MDYIGEVCPSVDKPSLFHTLYHPAWLSIRRLLLAQSEKPSKQKRRGLLHFKLSRRPSSVYYLNLSDSLNVKRCVGPNTFYISRPV